MFNISVHQSAAKHHIISKMSILKTGKARAIRISTLARLCEALDCQPGDLLEYRKPDAE